MARLRIAVDIGGTFVDAVMLDVDTRETRFLKVPSTPTRPAEAVRRAVLALAGRREDVEVFIHGTTLGLNAILERKGAMTGIITNEGLRDIFLFGRGNVPDEHMYDFGYLPPPPLVDRRHIIGVAGRIDARGRVVQDLDEEAVSAGARRLHAVGVKAVAICFLHSFRDPTHERRAAEIVRETCPDLHVSVSTELARELREYERTSTAVLDAYIRPIFEGYVDELERTLVSDGFAGRFLVMRSGGGAMTADAARQAPIHTVLSGPAGGAEGAGSIAKSVGRADLVSFDMGGTSLDVCVIQGGSAAAIHEAPLAGHPVLIPVFDVRTIGAGGGSVARVDSGVLRVGPESAGAAPGPLCYGRGGTMVTVTDAAVCLGAIDAEGFLAGAMPLDTHAARSGVDRLIAAPLGLSIVEAAAGIFDVLVAKTIGALRQITVEQGRDPREFGILAFGGAGPLAAPLVAWEMGFREVIVPPAPAAFSAWGMLGVDVVDDQARTDLRVLDRVAASDLEFAFTELGDRARLALIAQRVPPAKIAIERRLELRYQGQAHALTVALDGDLTPALIRRAFEETHTRRYGHAMDGPVEILNLRVRGVALVEPARLAAVPAAAHPPERARRGSRSAYCFAERRILAFPVYDRGRLARGDRIRGPALVDEGTSTTVVLSPQTLDVDPYGSLVIRPTSALEPST